MLIYKILLPPEWAAFETEGRFDGSPLDLDSGFIHCSGRNQVADTAMRFFHDEAVIVVVALDADALGRALRWEPVEDGGRFPHVYASLPLTAVVSVHQVADPASVVGILPAE